VDEKQENQDLVIGSSDSQSDSGVNIQVKTAEDTGSKPGPVINDIQAPPAPEAVIEDDDVAAVDSAVKEISDDSTEVPVEQPVTEAPAAEEQNRDNETQTDLGREPDVKEAPESSEPEPQAEKSSGSEVDPFASKPEETFATPVQSTAPQSMSNNEQSLPHEHRNNKKFAVIVTILVALLLAGAAVYVYISAQGNATETATKTTIDPNAQKIAEVTPATSADVDATLTDIDQTIKSIDDEADLSEASISDATLGL